MLGHSVAPILLLVNASNRVATWSKHDLLNRFYARGASMRKPPHHSQCIATRRARVTSKHLMTAFLSAPPGSIAIVRASPHELTCLIRLGTRNAVHAYSSAIFVANQYPLLLLAPCGCSMPSVSLQVQAGGGDSLLILIMGAATRLALYIYEDPERFARDLPMSPQAHLLHNFKGFQLHLSGAEARADQRSAQSAAAILPSGICHIYFSVRVTHDTGMD